MKYLIAYELSDLFTDTTINSLIIELDTDAFTEVNYSETFSYINDYLRDNYGVRDNQHILLLSFSPIPKQ